MTASMLSGSGATQSISATNTLTLTLGPAPIWVGTARTQGSTEVVQDYWSNAYISEILYFQAALSAGEISDLQAYLAEKWGFLQPLLLPPFPPSPPSPSPPSPSPPSPPPSPPPLPPEFDAQLMFAGVTNFSASRLVLWLDASDTSSLFQVG